MTVGVDLAVTITSLLLSLLDVEQHIMTGSPHLNSFSGHHSNKITIRWNIGGRSVRLLLQCYNVTLQEEERGGGRCDWWIVCLHQPPLINQLPGPGSPQTEGRVGLCPGGDQWSRHQVKQLLRLPGIFLSRLAVISQILAVTLLLQSPDLVNWKLVTHIFTAATLPSWAEDRFYAPELHLVAGRYILYFTAGDLQGKLSCGAAVASSEDPFSEYSVLYDQSSRGGDT